MSPNGHGETVGELGRPVRVALAGRDLVGSGLECRGPVGGARDRHEHERLLDRRPEAGNRPGESGKQLKQFGWIHEIACPSENELYVAEMLNWRVQKLTLHPGQSKSTAQ